MKFRMEFCIDNAAFGETAVERGNEIQDILTRLSNAPAGLSVFDEGPAAGAIFDSNGNYIGSWAVTE